MKKLILCCFAFCRLLSAQAQNWTWAETAGGILPDEANGCTMDSAGNMYASGFFFSSSINFGHGNSISNGGICDGFVVKYDAAGTSQWATKVKGTGEDKATRCAVDNAGNVFATGYFDSPSIQFGGNNANNVSNFDGSGNTFDCFLVKYNSAGTPLWFRAIGKSDDDGGAGVGADSAGNVYVTGWFRAPSIVAGGYTLYNNNPAGGTSDMFVIKYDPNGTVLWAKSAGGLDDDKGNACAVDRSGNIIVTGYFKADSINFEGTHYYGAGSKDAFVAWYNSNGTLLGVRAFGSTGGDEPFACSADAAGNIFVAGNYSGSSMVIDAQTLTNTGGGSEVFLVKFNPSLTAMWAISAGSNSNDEARGCTTDKYGNTVITGVFNGPTITFGGTVLSNNGGDEIFLAKYDANGNLFWAKKIGKSKDDGANDCAINNSGKIVVAGYYNSSSLTLGSITLDNSYTGISTSDVFVASTCLSSTGTDNQSACNAFTWIDGNTYTANNNTAIFNLPGGAANTCDSMVTLNLTILNPATGSDTRTACNSFTWIDGNTYTASNNTATYNLPGGASNSCDSLVTLNLTILNPATGFDNQTACGSFTWMDGNTYTANNNTATFNITGGAVNGCDSVVSLNLIIDTVDVGIMVAAGSITANASGATYKWLDCDSNFAFIAGETAQTFTPTSTGNYAVEVTQNSCVDTSVCMAISVLGIRENPFNQPVIYPNPNNGIVNFNFGSLKNVSVNVFNLSGQMIYQKENIQTTTDQVELKEADGIYLVELISNGEKWRHKLIVSQGYP